MADEERILSGRYRLLEPLGEGGMGTVWKAQHIELDTLVAVKLIDEDLAESASVLRRFKSEAKAAAALSSAHVVRTFDYGVDQGAPFLVMELLEGESLEQRLERVGQLSLAETAAILSQVARALDQAHARGIIHRDIKPGNIFLTRDEHGGDLAKVLDFGVAKSLGLDISTMAHTRTGTLVGSPSYMSPEQMHSRKDLDHTTDLWSLGVVAFECILGERPFPGESLPQLTVAICLHPIPVPSEVGDVPPSFDAWFAKTCDRDPKARYQSAGECAEALAAVTKNAGSVAAVARTTGFRRVAPTATTPSSENAVLSQSTDALVRSREQLPEPGPTSQAARRAAGLGAVAVGVVLLIGGLWLLGRNAVSPDTAPEAVDSNASPEPSASEPEVTPVETVTEAVIESAKASASASASAVAKTVAPEVTTPSKTPPRPAPAAKAAPAARRPVATTPQPPPAKKTAPQPKTRDYGF